MGARGRTSRAFSTARMRSSCESAWLGRPIDTENSAPLPHTVRGMGGRRGEGAGEKRCVAGYEGVCGVCEGSAWYV